MSAKIVLLGECTNRAEELRRWNGPSAENPAESVDYSVVFVHAQISLGASGNLSVSVEKDHEDADILELEGRYRLTLTKVEDPE